MPFKNPAILFIGIKKYTHMKHLPSVSKDFTNVSNTFGPGDKSLNYHIISNDTDKELCQMGLHDLATKYLKRINDKQYHHDGGIVWFSCHAALQTIFLSDSYVESAGETHKYGQDFNDADIQLFKFQKTLEKQSPDNFRYIYILDCCLGENKPNNQKLRQLPVINIIKENMYAAYKPCPEYSLLDHATQERKFNERMAKYKTNNDCDHISGYNEIWMGGGIGEYTYGDTFTTSLTKVAQGILDYHGCDEIVWDQYKPMIVTDMTSEDNKYVARFVSDPLISGAFVRSKSDKNGIEIINDLRSPNKWYEFEYEEYPFGDWSKIDKEVQTVWNSNSNSNSNNGIKKCGIRSGSPRRKANKLTKKNTHLNRKYKNKKKKKNIKNKLKKFKGKKK
eukprot:337572_1